MNNLLPMSVLLMLSIGCGHQAADDLESPAMSPTARITFLGRVGCVNTPVLLENLKTAIRTTGVEAGLSEIDQLSLPESDPRRGYPTPTILFDGDDLFGLEEPEPPFLSSCRIYPGGVPSSEAIAERLRSLHQSAT